MVTDNSLLLLISNEQHQKLRDTPSPAKLLKGVEENSVTQTGRLRSFRGEGTPHRKR